MFNSFPDEKKRGNTGECRYVVVGDKGKNVGLEDEKKEPE